MFPCTALFLWLHCFVWLLLCSSYKCWCCVIILLLCASWCVTHAQLVWQHMRVHNSGFTLWTYKEELRTRNLKYYDSYNCLFTFLYLKLSPYQSPEVFLWRRPNYPVCRSIGWAWLIQKNVTALSYWFLKIETVLCSCISIIWCAVFTVILVRCWITPNEYTYNICIFVMYYIVPTLFWCKYVHTTYVSWMWIIFVVLYEDNYLKWNCEVLVEICHFHTPDTGTLCILF
jgi:hypothetical protein